MKEFNYMLNNDSTKLYLWLHRSVGLESQYWLLRIKKSSSASKSHLSSKYSHTYGFHN
uniref:Uncharacterized protein n=1 Tax=Rhizophora mucronata TaxID=61149 RepID=A0A2P2QBA3_RHIMU